MGHSPACRTRLSYGIVSLWGRRVKLHRAVNARIAVSPAAGLSAGRVWAFIALAVWL